MSTLNTTNIKHPSSASNNIVLDSGGGATFSQIKGGAITSGTAVASTSGTAIDFTGIPSWVKRITVMFSGVSTNGTSAVQVQIGDSGGIENTGYLGSVTTIVTGTATAQLSAGFSFATAAGDTAASVRHGVLTMNLLGSNLWSAFGILGFSNEGRTVYVGGSKTLSDTLTQLRITTVNGTNTFDAGTINILYEG